MKTILYDLESIRETSTETKMEFISNYQLLDAAGKAATAIEKCRKKKTLQKGRPSVLPGPIYKLYYWFLIACPSRIPCCNRFLDRH
jgi:hypothetical protein